METVRKVFRNDHQQLLDVGGKEKQVEIVSLVLVNGNISSVEYWEILREGLLNSAIITNDILFLFKQDNARLPHHSIHLCLV